ncbi:MAG TPA: T6SS immunity protein Tdi1 domain-containing protein [Chryseosolibacter sp.]|nr:T6SS immunity protein Tdi1 domain-containing protein [Chryseosolibacter sp.]
MHNPAMIRTPYETKPIRNYGGSAASSCVRKINVNMGQTLLPAFFSKCATVSNGRVPLECELLEQYKNQVPQEIIELWRIGGIGSYLDDFLWVVNPKVFEPILAEIYMPFEQPCIVFARDAFGDLFVWEKQWFVFVNVRHGYSHVVGRKAGFFFNNIMTEWEFFSHRIKANNYHEVKDRLGPVKADECYGYVPLLAGGGEEKIENIRVVPLREHIGATAKLAGKIG